MRATDELSARWPNIILAGSAGSTATIQNADRIIVLDKGMKMEEGSHQQLLKHNGLYRELYEIQFEGSDRDRRKH